MVNEASVDSAWVSVEFEALFVDPRQGSPVVVLREVQGNLILPIWIGPFEAQAIALALGGVRPPRPMTHDLLVSVVQQLGAKLTRLEIHSLEEGTFFSRLVLDPAGIAAASAGRFADGSVLIDSRPSDGLALALRMRAPVVLAREVLEKAGVPRPSHVPMPPRQEGSGDSAEEGADAEVVRAWSEWLAQSRKSGSSEPV